MEHLSIEDVDHVDHPAEVNSVRKPLSRALGATDCGVVYHELEPGEAFSGALHAHYDQEELFYIIEGTATFEVGADRDRVEVAAGECIRFAPGEFQHGFNDSDERVVGLIISAPGAEHGWDEQDLIIACRTCGEETVHGIEPVAEGSWQAETVHLRVECNECGTSYTTADVVG